MPTPPLLPASMLALLVVVLVVVVPVVAMGLALLSASRAADPLSTPLDFWSGLLDEQRARGATFGTPEVAPIGKSEPAPVPVARPVQARSPLVVRPYAYRADMTLRELLDTNRARAARRNHDRVQFSMLMATLRPRAVGRHRALVA